MKRFALALMFILAVSPASSFAQEREDRTLLSWNQLRAIINEVSGERAQQTVLEMVPYPRVRPAAEYEGTFRESQVMARLVREYGFSNVEIETFPTQQKMWQATQAELWMVKPTSRKVYDFRDVAVSIASGSETGDVTADLIDVGNGGRAEDYAGKDVKGKIVLGTVSSGQVQRLAFFERGAVDGQKRLTALEPLLDQQAVALQAQVTAVYQLAATRLNAPLTEPLPTEVEQKAARTIVEPVAGMGGGRGGFGGPPASQPMAQVGSVKLTERASVVAGKTKRK